MRKLLVVLFSAVIVFSSSIAGSQTKKAEVKKTAASGNSSIIKLGMFASACDGPPITSLLRRDSTFDINASPGAHTAVQLAQIRLGQALSSNESEYRTACVNTIIAIMSDRRYSWREAGTHQTTDLMHFVSVLKDESKDNMRTTLGPILKLLKEKISDFDVNYRLKAQRLPTEAGTVAGSLVQTGNVDAWCMVTKTFPLSLEERPSEDYYTPLLLAIAQNKIDMVKLLIGEGADWDVYLTDYPTGWAAEEIARANTYTNIEEWLVQHKQSRNAAVSGCEQTGDH